MPVDRPPPELEDQIYTALKSWHDDASEVSPLYGLWRFREIQSAGALNNRQALNELLLEGLKKLEAEDILRADVLRHHFLETDTIQALANRNNISEPTVYRWQKRGVARLVELIYAQELKLRRRHQAELESRLESPTYTHLVGAEESLNHLLFKLTEPNPPWFVSIEGMGGLGKTALADALSRKVIQSAQYANFAWISAKQEDFQPGIGPINRDKPALEANSLVEALLHQLNPEPFINLSTTQKLARLTGLLKSMPTLMVIDNLETALDHQSLLPLLRQLVNPGKILLTSRTSLQAYSDVFCYKLPPLSETDALALIKQEAALRGIKALIEAKQAQLKEIYNLVGGNALALKLVVGQISVLPLSQALANLAQARGKEEEALYTYLYWQAWRNLDANSQALLLTMPLIQQGSFEQLIAISGLNETALASALQHLHTLSLVQVGGGLENRRYSLHRLTQTFLLHEALQWHKPA